MAKKKYNICYKYLHVIKFIILSFSNFITSKVKVCQNSSSMKETIHKT